MFKEQVTKYRSYLVGGVAIGLVALIIFAVENSSVEVSSNQSGAQTAQPLVGAFRHDDWDANNPIGPDWAKLTTDPAYRSRLPYHAIITGPTTAYVNENTQAVIDQDILYAHNAGIDFWAVGSACSWGKYTFERMKTSQYRSLMQIASIQAAPLECRVDYLIEQIKNPQYLTVLKGRPVVFVLWYYRTDGSAATIASLRQRVMAETGRPNPYLVAVDFSGPAAASFASAFGLDAITTYGGGLVPGAGYVPYSDQVSLEERGWHEYKDTGWQHIPTVTTGWQDISDPRIFTTTPESTPAKIASHLTNALNFIAAYPESNQANLLLISAWNEYTENHYLVPYNPATNPIGTGRIDAVSAVLNGTTPPGPPKSASSTRCIAIPSLSRLFFSAGTKQLDLC